MARTALRAGCEVVLANSRGPESLTSELSALGHGATAGTVEQAAGADIVVLAVPWPRVPQAVDGPDWSGRIVIDATNDFDPSDLNGRTSSELIADLVAGARVVKAANTLGAAVLGRRSARGRRPARDLPVRRRRRREVRGGRIVRERRVLRHRPRRPAQRRRDA